MLKKNLGFFVHNVNGETSLQILTRYHKNIMQNSCGEKWKRF